MAWTLWIQVLFALCLVIESGNGKSLGNLSASGNETELDGTQSSTTTITTMPREVVRLPTSTTTIRKLVGTSESKDNLDVKNSDDWMSGNSLTMIFGGIAVLLLIVVVILSIVTVVLCRRLRPKKAHFKTKAHSSREERISITPDSPSWPSTATTSSRVESLKYDQPITNPHTVAIAKWCYKQAEMPKGRYPQDKNDKAKIPCRRSDWFVECPVDEDDYLTPTDGKNDQRTIQPGKGKKQMEGSSCSGNTTEQKVHKNAAKSKTESNESDPKLDEANYLIITHRDGTHAGKEEADGTAKGQGKPVKLVYKIPKGAQKVMLLDTGKLNRFSEVKKSSGVGSVSPGGKKLTKSLSQGNLSDIYKVPRSQQPLHDKSGYVLMDMCQAPAACISSSDLCTYDVPYVGRDPVKSIKSVSQGCLDQGYEVPSFAYENCKPLFR